MTFVSEKGDVPPLRPSCVKKDCTNFVGSGGAVATVQTLGTELRVQGCLSPQTCRDPVDFYHTGIAADVVDGVASFSSLNVDFEGHRFRLRYELQGTNATVAAPGSYFSRYDLQSTNATIAVTGSYFSVITGEPTYLHVHQPAAIAYGNGQPFGQQPVVVVQDAGRNRIHQLTKWDGYITASLVPAHQVRTNTSMVAVLFAGAGCTGKRRRLNEKDFPPGFLVDGWDACEDKWDDGTDIVRRCHDLLELLVPQ